jgi:hypothetical protein
MKKTSSFLTHKQLVRSRPFKGAPAAPPPPERTYRSTDRGVETPCLRCAAWTPLWGASKITCGHLGRIPNPRLGSFNPKLGMIDTRDTIVIPFLRSGVGCPACADAFLVVVATTGTGRTAFLPDKE